VGNNLIDKICLQKKLSRLAAKRTSDFVGLGVIAYNNIEGLPVVPLGSHLDACLNLPISGESNVMNALSSMATRGSCMHDGFHLIEVNSGSLTHVAQFVSPPLCPALANPLATWPQGARQMTALLISTLPQVDFSAVVSVDGHLHFYEDGVEEKEACKCE